MKMFEESEEKKLTGNLKFNAQELSINS